MLVHDLFSLLACTSTSPQPLWHATDCVRGTHAEASRRYCPPPMGIKSPVWSLTSLPVRTGGSPTATVWASALAACRSCQRIATAALSRAAYAAIRGKTESPGGIFTRALAYALGRHTAKGVGPNRVLCALRAQYRYLSRLSRPMFGTVACPVAVPGSCSEWAVCP